MTTFMKICIASVAIVFVSLKGLTLFKPYMFEHPAFWFVTALFASLALFFIVASYEPGRKKMTQMEWMSSPRKR